MTDVYLEISKLSDKFRTMAYGLTHNETDIDEAVQELMLYFLSMNPETLKGIWDKDGEDGIIRYGAVVLRRSLTSTRSPFIINIKNIIHILIILTIVVLQLLALMMWHIILLMINIYQIFLMKK